MNILALGCHPDDIEFGCGGTLAKYAAGGHDVYMMVMTEGHAGGEHTTRKEEGTRAAEIIGCKHLYWGGYHDTELALDRSLIQQLEQVIEATKPAFIFVHYGEDTHQDHRVLNRATVTATRYARNVLFYEGPTTQNFTPSVFVALNEVIDRKIEALAAHASQVEKTNIGDLNIIELAEACSLFRGTQARIKHAEGFVPLRLFINVDPEV